MDLGDKVAGPNDGSSHQLRKERNEKDKILETMDGFQFAIVDIQGIAPSLEGKEADSHRQDDVHCG